MNKYLLSIFGLSLIFILSGCSSDIILINGGGQSSNSSINTTVINAEKVTITKQLGELLYAKRTAAFDFVGYRRAAGTWTDITAEASTSWGVVSGDVLDATGDTFVMGRSTQFNTVYIDVGTATSTGGIFVWEYSIGNDLWSAIPGVVDGTGNLSADGVVEFSIPGDWVTTTQNISAPLYFIRIRVTGGAFTTEPTVYLVVPTDGAALAEFYANAGDTVPTTCFTRNGAVNIGYPCNTSSSSYRLYINGGIGMSGTLSGVGALSTSGGITSSISTGGKTATIGISQSGSLATSLIPEQDSVDWRLGGSAFDPLGVARTNTWAFRLIQVSNSSPTKSRMSLKMVTDSGTASDRELATITSDGDMHIFSNRFGPECLTNGAMSSAANWTVTGGWAYSTSDFTYTTAGGPGTLRQNAANMSITFKPYTWYYVNYTVGVAAPTGTLAWIGTEAAEYNTYFSMSTTEVPFFFRTGASPTDFVIYTNATTTSGFRIDDMSIREVYEGNLYAGIVHLDNISIHASDNYSQMMCITVNSTGSINTKVGAC